MLEYILLGLLQGVTEFLPVSSSGHLVIAQSLIKDFHQPGILFDVILHFATFMAVIVYFWKRIKILLKGFLGIFVPGLRVTYFDNKTYIWGIFWASIPTGVIGLYLNHKAETLFSSTTMVGYSLLLTSLILFFSDKKNPSGSLTLGKSFLVGIVQGLAVIPGISRSGSTIASLIYMNVKREEAAEFSFLMALPAVLGATILQIKDLPVLDYTLVTNYSSGMIAAFLAGLFSIHTLLLFIKKASLKIFALYCLIIGIISIVWL